MSNNRNLRYDSATGYIYDPDDASIRFHIDDDPNAINRVVRSDWDYGDTPEYFPEHDEDEEEQTMSDEQKHDKTENLRREILNNGFQILSWGSSNILKYKGFTAIVKTNEDDCTFGEVRTPNGNWLKFNGDVEDFHRLIDEYLDIDNDSYINKRLADIKNSLKQEQQMDLNPQAWETNDLRNEQRKAEIWQRLTAKAKEIDGEIMNCAAPKTKGAFDRLTQPEGFTFADRLDVVINDIRSTLIEKNSKYGDSALKPQAVFAHGNAADLIRVRIDDKLARIRNGVQDEEDTVKDLIGYLLLLRMAS